MNVFDPANNNFVYDAWPIQFLPRTFHVLIQTDKELYKAEDAIRFRLFAFDSDTRPVDVGGSPVVSIIDPHGFTIRNITNITFAHGRYKNEFQLSNFVTPGVWIIRIFAENQVIKTETDFVDYNESVSGF